MIQHSRWLALVLTLMMVSTARAQTAPPAQGAVFPAPQLMAGFVANAPDQLAGGAVAWLPSFADGWGLYLDAKFDVESPINEVNYLTDLTATEALATGDEERVSESSFTTVNLALVRAFREDVVVYLGGGVSDETVFVEFYDPSQQRGRLGNYWTKREDAGGLRANAVGGVFFRLARHVSAQFGVEAVPSGFTVGLHFTL